MIKLSILVASIMFLVALFHFYWAFGGNYGLSSAGPSFEGKESFVPGSILIFFVACVLLGIAVLSILLVFPSQLFGGVTPYLGYLASLVFILRGIGDFRYVGLFKKVYNSKFSKLDTKYFSPLIILLGIAYGLLAKYGN